MPKGLTIRAFARRLGLHESTVREARDAGKLKGAVYPSGRINAPLAEKLLAENTTVGKNIAPDLALAKHRKLCAKVALLGREVGELLRSVVRPKDAADSVLEHLAELRNHLTPWPAEMAPKLVDRSVHEVARLIRSEVIDLTSRMRQTPACHRDTDSKPDPNARPLIEMTPKEVEAIKAKMEAVRIEAKEGLASGELMEGARALEQFGIALRAVRDRLVNLEGKAPRFTGSNVSRIEKALHSEVESIIETLDAMAFTAEMRRAGPTFPGPPAQKMGTGRQ